MFYINSTDNCVNTVKSYISQEEQTQLKEETRRILDSIETCEIRIPIGAAARGEGGGRRRMRPTDGRGHTLLPLVILPSLSPLFFANFENFAVLKSH